MMNGRWWSSLRVSLSDALVWSRQRIAYCLALLPILTDWVDTGHWPHQLRELSSEVVIGALILVGVHRLHHRAEAFRRASETDPLTGLGNRLRFRRDVEQAVRRAESSGGNLALAFIDVDAFKQVNDSRGHHVGDQVLKEVGQALSSSVRQGVDACYRLGGDEFAVIVEGASHDQAMAALERGFQRASHIGLFLSCSVGVVTLGQSEGAPEMLRRADELMYRAKRDEALENCDLGSFSRIALSH